MGGLEADCAALTASCSACPTTLRVVWLNVHQGSLLLRCCHMFCCLLCSIDCAGMYVCCIDVELQNQLVLMCGIFDPATTPFKSKIVVYDGRPGMALADR